MNDIKTTALFIGNRDCYSVTESEIERAIIQAIDSGIDTFLSGGLGFFDEISARVLHKVKSNYPHVKSILVVPFKRFEPFDSSLFDEIVYPFEERVQGLINNRNAIPIRNRIMVESASLAICFVERMNGGASKTMNYAITRGLKIIDLTTAI